MRGTKNSASGATLVELLVAVGICTVVASLLLPAVQQGRAAARTTGCSNNARQLGLASLAFHDLHGHLPTAPLESADSPGYALDLLPHLEQLALWQRFDLSKSVGADVNLVAASTGRPPAYRCPANRDVPISVRTSSSTSLSIKPVHFLFGAQVVGLRLAEIPETTRTLLARDSRSDAIFWHASPVAATVSDSPSDVVHPGGNVVLFVSGRVEVRRNGEGIVLRPAQ